MKTKAEICPVCGTGTLSVRSDHTYRFKHAHKIHTVEGLSHTVCDECGTSMFMPKQMQSNHELVERFQAELKNYISPNQVLELREKYEITQVQAAHIFGGGPTAFSKYERGQASPSGGTARQMLAALRDPAFMVATAKAHGVNIKAPINSSQASSSKAIESLPKEVRSKVEEYAAHVKLSLQDACVALINQGLKSFVQMSEVSAASVVARITAPRVSTSQYVIDSSTAVRIERPSDLIQNPESIVFVVTRKHGTGIARSQLRKAQGLYIGVLGDQEDDEQEMTVEVDSFPSDLASSLKPLKTLRMRR